jgi:alpha-ketoglutaric semialdehyde dehydrogenase
MHPGVFSLIQGGKRDVGQALVQHPLIKAVGFTGSLAAAARCSTSARSARADPVLRRTGFGQPDVPAA